MAKTQIPQKQFNGRLHGPVHHSAKPRCSTQLKATEVVPATPIEADQRVPVTVCACACACACVSV